MGAYVSKTFFALPSAHGRLFGGGGAINRVGFFHSRNWVGRFSLLSGSYTAVQCMHVITNKIDILKYFL